MKRIVSFMIASALLLFSMSSCLRDADDSPTGKAEDTGEPNQTIKNIVTEQADDSEPETPFISNNPLGNTAEPATVYPISFYSQSPETGEYLRCTEWSTDFLASNEDGTPYDLAVFGLIPSNEPTLSGYYSDVWKTEADRVGVLMDSTDVDFTVSYMLDSGETEIYDIGGPGDAEDVGELGYIEMYLYDDVHQEPGVRYSHLTEESLNDWVVVTTVKLTAGEKIDDVEQIFLTVRIAPKGEDMAYGAATIQIKRPEAETGTDGVTGESDSTETDE